MKKLFLSTVLIAAIGSASFAQVSIGINTGVNFYTAKVKANDTTIKGSLQTGYHAGITADIALTPELHAFPSLQFIQRGVKLKYENAGTLGPATVVNTTSITNTINYIELPLNIVYNFDLGESAKFFIGTGPSFAYAIAGKSKGSSTTTVKIGTQSNSSELAIDQKLKFGKGNDNDIKPLDIGWNGLAGVKLNNGFALALNYTYSFTNISSKDNSSIKGSGFGATLHYFFNVDDDKK
jgi:opacity protein-like surface antigen